MFARNKTWPKLTIITLLCVFCIASGTGWAGGRSPAGLVGGKSSVRGASPIFELLDENRDQRVDRTEFRVGIVGAFEMYDINHDNALSRAELPSVKLSDFDRADHNNDGWLSVSEFIGSDFMQFSRFDRNRDGFVTYNK